MKIAKTFPRLVSAFMAMAMLFTFLPTFSVVAQGGDITVYVSFEGYNLGHGFYIEPTAITLPAGSFASAATIALLTERNHTFDYEAHLEGSAAFFLDNISGFNHGFINPPAYITERIALRQSDAVEGGYLAAFMFSSYSGWMITINHEKIDIGAGSLPLANGDVIRWQFSVYGHGADLGVPMGDWGGEQLYNHADKTELIRAIFLPGVGAVAQQAALDVIINPLATDEEVEHVTNLLLETADLDVDGYFNGWYVVNNPDGNLQDRLLEIVNRKYGLSPLNLTGVSAIDVMLFRERLSRVERLRITGTMNVADFRPGNATAVTGWGTGLLAQHSGAGLNFTDTGVVPAPYLTHAAILNSLIELDLSAVTTITNENNAAIISYPNRALRGLRNLERVRLPADREISNGMLQYAQRLTAITFGNDAFVDNTFDFRGLEVLIFGGAFNFQHSNVSEIIFPANVTNIPNSMFANSTNLRTVHFHGAFAPTLGTNVFNNINPRPVAIVPNNTTGGYEATAFFNNNFSLVISRDGGGLNLLPLFNLINTASSKNDTAYTPESWSDVAAALTAARYVLNNITSETEQDDVDYAFNTLQNAISALEVRFDNVTFINVPAGTNVGAFRKSANHFAPFTVFPISLHEELGEREVWRALIPMNQAFHIEAYIPGETAKIALRKNALTTAGTTITVDPTPLAEWIDGRGTSWQDANVLTNLGDSGSLNLTVGQTFNLDTFRVWQAMDGLLLNYFIEPEYNIELFGENASWERIGSPGREQISITAQQPGISVIKITYNPVEYVRTNGNRVFFDGIDPRNTLVIPINVVSAIPNFDTGINMRNDFDTFYFDKTDGFGEFTFTPASGSSVRVHEPLNSSIWGEGWESYSANDDGSFTVELQDGRNIIEITNGEEVQFHVIHARGVEVIIENITRPGMDFAVGDRARISITGLIEPIEKLAGIYNPGFGSALQSVMIYSNGVEAFESNGAFQFRTLETTFTFEYTLTDTNLNVLTGNIRAGAMGSPLGAHRNIPLNGVPNNFDAIAVGPFMFGSLPEIVLPIASEPDTITVYMTLEGYNLGHGFYIEPIAVTVPYGTSALTAILDLLYYKGLEYDLSMWGTLGRVYEIHPGTAPNPPSYITVTLGAGSGDGSVGEFDYTPASGWMNTVNHFLPDVGAADYILMDGDVIRWQFSVENWGEDLGLTTEWGAWEDSTLYEHFDKTELIRALFLPGVDADAKQNALDVIINPTATEEEIAAALAKLLNPSITLMYITEDLRDADMFTFTVRLTDPAQSLTQVMLVTALYDSNSSVLQHVEFRTVSLKDTWDRNKGDMFDIISNYVPLLGNNRGNTLKIFIWGDNMIPLMNDYLYKRIIN